MRVSFKRSLHKNSVRERYLSKINLKEFEDLLELWKVLFTLDDSFYFKILLELNLDSLDSIATYRYIIRFLELWGVRQSAIKLNPQELCRKIIEFKPILNELETSLIYTNLNEVKTKIEYAFESFSSIKYVGPTSASKILHLLKPSFFVMWDRAIAKYYECDMTMEGYFNFLTEMKDAINTLLKQYSEKYLNEKPEEALSRKYGGKPLTKLIDEYNWLKTRIWLNKVIKLVKQGSF